MGKIKNAKRNKSKKQKSKAFKELNKQREEGLVSGTTIDAQKSAAEQLKFQSYQDNKNNSTQQQGRRLFPELDYNYENLSNVKNNEDLSKNKQKNIISHVLTQISENRFESFSDSDDDLEHTRDGPNSKSSQEKKKSFKEKKSQSNHEKNEKNETQESEPSPEPTSNWVQFLKQKKKKNKGNKNNSTENKNQKKRKSFETDFNNSTAPQKKSRRIKEDSKNKKTITETVGMGLSYTKRRCYLILVNDKLEVIKKDDFKNNGKESTIIKKRLHSFIKENNIKTVICYDESLISRFTSRLPCRVVDMRQCPVYAADAVARDPRAVARKYLGLSIKTEITGMDSAKLSLQLYNMFKTQMD
eukprot:gb/GECH01003111.1/.p1 GENE.gb/GECH01003111.1/~~gb/GECH01003111.1/.p1  ORF type:complete len:357 (+),score=115.97 gb/GECH01003111.1/:1-1071(+)